MDRIGYIHQRMVAARDLREKRELHEAYSALSEEEGVALARYALASSDSNIAEEILLTLACFVPNSLRSFHEELIAREQFNPGELYRVANAWIATLLIQRLYSMNEPDTLLRSHLLRALAWIGDATVRTEFARWQEAPPNWSSELFIAPEAYAHEAGWELDTAGGRRQLFADACYSLQLASSEEAEAITGTCPWCNGPLVALFDFDLGDPRVAFLSMDGTRLRIAMCVRCTDYATIFTEVDGQGTSRWSDHNRRPEFIGYDDDIPVYTWWEEVTSVKIIGEPRRTPYEAHYYVVDWLGMDASQIGGFPTWVQDADHPLCPICRTTMPFVAQFSSSESDGMIYAFLCAPCGIAATSSQYS